MFLIIGADYGARFSRELRARSSTVADVHRKSALYRFPFEPLHHANKKTLRKGVFFNYWSGLRGSNPPPPPWQGGALPNELNPHINGASGRNRTNDTRIFSPLLYQLSYRGGRWTCTKMATRMGLEPTTSSVTG